MNDKFEFDEYDMLEALRALQDRIRATEGSKLHAQAHAKAKKAYGRLHILYTALKKRPLHHGLVLVRSKPSPE